MQAEWPDTGYGYLDWKCKRSGCLKCIFTLVYIMYVLLFSSGDFSLVFATFGGSSGNTIRSVFEPCVVLREYFFVVSECLVHKRDFCDTGKIIRKRFLALHRYLNNFYSHLLNIAAIVMVSSRHTPDGHISCMAGTLHEKYWLCCRYWLLVFFCWIFTVSHYTTAAIACQAYSLPQITCVCSMYSSPVNEDESACHASSDKSLKTAYEDVGYWKMLL